MSVDSLGKMSGWMDRWSRAVSSSCPQRSPWSTALHLALLWLHLHLQDCQNTAFWGAFLLRVVTHTAPYVSFLLSLLNLPYVLLTCFFYFSLSISSQRARISGTWFTPVRGVLWLAWCVV